MTTILKSLINNPITFFGKKCIYMLELFFKISSDADFFFLMATPAAYGSSLARNWIWATAGTQATATATPGPLTHRARMEPATLQQPKMLQSGF